MLKRVAVVTGIIVGLGSAIPAAHGHKQTEIFIPIGQSPGLSNKVTLIGTVQRIDSQSRTVAVVSSGGTWSCTVTERTRIWLDRSKQRLTNQSGTFADLKPGSLVEIKYEDLRGRTQGTGPAEWLKVEVTR